MGGAESECCWSRDQIWQACLVACPEFFHGVAGFLGVPAWSGHMRLSSCSQVNRESPLYSTLLYPCTAKNSGFGLDHKCSSIW